MPTPNFNDPRERMRHAREAMLAGAVARARAMADGLGITLTDEQAADAGLRLLKREQAARADVAREGKAAKKAEEDQTFAIVQAKAAAQRYLDLYGSYRGDDAANVLRFMLDIASEESLAPDGFTRPRLMRRLNLAVDEARMLAENTTARLEASLPEVNFDDLPTSDDYAAEDGVAPWALR
jgi:hypothetical protein